MDIRFSLNHTEQYALNESRYWDFYNVARSYCGIKVGERWSSENCYNFLKSAVLIRTDEDGITAEDRLNLGVNSDEEDRGLFVYMRGKQYDLSIILKAIEVNWLMTVLKSKLRDLHQHGAGDKGSMTALKKAIRDLKSALDSTEW